MLGFRTIAGLVLFSIAFALVFAGCVGYRSDAKKEVFISKGASKVPSLCVVAQLLNEGHIFQEWIEHYLRQGVEKFFLIDNGSTDVDQYAAYLDEKIRDGTLEMVIDTTRHRQIFHYNHYFLDKVRDFDWVAVCDFDEFIYARKGFSTIVEYLQTLPSSVGEVCIPWKMFGASGYTTLDREYSKTDTVVGTFVQRCDYDGDGAKPCALRLKDQTVSLGKSIARTAYLLKMGVHNHGLSHKAKSITSDNTVNKLPDKKFSRVCEEAFEKSALHLNHYVVQSFRWFMMVKSTRGAADAKRHEHIRTEEYFHSYDQMSSDMEDRELSLLNAKNRSSN